MSKASRKLENKKNMDESLNSKSRSNIVSPARKLKLMKETEQSIKKVTKEKESKSTRVIREKDEINKSGSATGKNTKQTESVSRKNTKEKVSSSRKNTKEKEMAGKKVIKENEPASRKIAKGKEPTTEKDNGNSALKQTASRFFKNEKNTVETEPKSRKRKVVENLSANDHCPSKMTKVEAEERLGLTSVASSSNTQQPKKVDKRIKENDITKVLKNQLSEIRQRVKPRTSKDNTKEFIDEKTSTEEEDNSFTDDDASDWEEVEGRKIAQKRKEKEKIATVPIRRRKYNSKEMNEKSRGHNNDDYGKKIIKRPVVETKKDKGPKKRDKDDDSSSDDGDSDWEEVEELPDTDLKSQIPLEPFEIVINATNGKKKGAAKKSKEEEIKDEIRRRINRFRTRSQEDMHKVHLLCILSVGQYQNNLCSNELLKATAYSIVPLEFVKKKPDSWGMNGLNSFVDWFSKTYLLDDTLEERKELYEKQVQILLSRISDQKVATEQEHIQLFVITCRSLGLDTRLVYSLQPISHKPNDLVKNQQTTERYSQIPKVPKSKKPPRAKSPKPPCSGDESGKLPKAESAKSNGPSSSKAKTSKPAKPKIVKEKAAKLSDDSETGEAVHEESSVKKSSTKNNRPRRRASKVSYVKENGEGNSDSDFELSSTAENGSSDEWDSDSEEEMSNKRTSSSQSKSRRASVQKLQTNSKRNRKGSGDDFDETKKFRQSSKINSKRKKAKEVSYGSDWWAEVYVEKEAKWIYVNSLRKAVGAVKDAEEFATKPMTFVLAYDNAFHVKDLTKKYVSNWSSTVSKLRPFDDWWNIVLSPFRKIGCNRDASEDSQILDNLLKKPLPTTISEYKNHPLYALPRHLLKFEAIYPPTALILGYVRNEPVYARECVHTLHTREKWLLEGRSVRIGEEPYKIVKARPKWHPKRGMIDEKLTVNTYGKWQTEMYMSAPAYQGKLPKNEYGNIELFKPWMLPAGAVYLEEALVGMNKIAKKLEIDCAPAMLGWEFSGGNNHPIIRGWIVCEEHKDILLSAWQEDQKLQREKQSELREQRVLDNWRTLVRGLQIKERLKKRFELQEPTVKRKKEDLGDDDHETVKEKTKKSREVVVEESKKSWPENLKSKEENKRTLRSRAKDDKNLFPFEKDEL